MLNSLSNLSWIISKWSIPKNPHLNPKPRAEELSGTKTREASFNCNFSIEDLRSSYSSVSTGYIPAKTMGLTSSNPETPVVSSESASIIVSPTFTSLAFLIPVIRYPTSPAFIHFFGVWVRFRVPTSSALYLFWVAMNLIACPFLICPEKTLKYVSTPLKGLYTESKIKAFKGASWSVLGSGISEMIASRICSIPNPVLAEALIISSFLHPSKSMISSLTSSGLAEGRSTLFKTGIISKSFSKAR